MLEKTLGGMQLGLVIFQVLTSTLWGVHSRKGGVPTFLRETFDLLFSNTSVLVLQ